MESFISALNKKIFMLQASAAAINSLSWSVSMCTSGVRAFTPWH